MCAMRDMRGVSRLLRAARPSQPPARAVQALDINGFLVLKKGRMCETLECMRYIVQTLHLPTLCNFAPSYIAQTLHLP